MKPETIAAAVDRHDARELVGAYIEARANGRDEAASLATQILNRADAEKEAGGRKPTAGAVRDGEVDWRDIRRDAMPTKAPEDEQAALVRQYQDARIEAGKLYHNMTGGDFSAAGRRAATRHEDYAAFKAARAIRDEAALKIDADRERLAPYLQRFGVSDAKLDADVKSAIEGVRDTDVSTTQQEATYARSYSVVEPDPAVTPSPIYASDFAAGSAPARLSEVQDLRSLGLARDAERSEVLLPANEGHQLGDESAMGDGAVRWAGDHRGAEAGTESGEQRLDARPTASAQPPASVAQAHPRDLVEGFKAASQAHDKALSSLSHEPESLRVATETKNRMVAAAHAVARVPEAMDMAKAQKLSESVDTITTTNPETTLDSMLSEGREWGGKLVKAAVGSTAEEEQTADLFKSALGKVMDVATGGETSALRAATEQLSQDPIAAFKEVAAHCDAAIRELGIDPEAMQHAAMAMEQRRELAREIMDDHELFQQAEEAGIGDQVEHIAEQQMEMEREETEDVSMEESSGPELEM